jgi:hypothetical protein
MTSVGVDTRGGDTPLERERQTKKGADARPSMTRCDRLAVATTFQWSEFWRPLQRLPIDIDARQRLAIIVGPELDGIPFEGDFPRTDAEETTDLDDQRRDPALLIDDQIGDAADFLPAGILHRAANEVLGQVLVLSLLAHDRVHADGRSLAPLCYRRLALAFGRRRHRGVAVLPALRRGLFLRRPDAGHTTRLELGHLGERITLDVQPRDGLVVLEPDLDGVPAHTHQAAIGLALEPLLVAVFRAACGLTFTAIVRQHARPGHLQELVVDPNDQPCYPTEAVYEQVRDFPDPLALAILCRPSDQLFGHELIPVLRSDEGILTMVPGTSLARLGAVSLRQHQRWRHQNQK